MEVTLKELSCMDSMVLSSSWGDILQKQRLCFMTDSHEVDVSAGIIFLFDLYFFSSSRGNAGKLATRWPIGERELSEVSCCMQNGATA